MKKSMLIILLSLATNAFSQTTIEKSKIESQSLNKNVINAAIGKDSTAGVGAVILKKAKVKNSVVRSQSLNENVINAAIGKGSTAAVGSVVTN